MFSVHCVHCFRWPFAVDRSHPRKPIRGQQNRVYWLVRPPPTQSGATRDSVGGQGRECTFSWMPPGSRLHPEGRGEAVVGKCAARVCVCESVCWLSLGWLRAIKSECASVILFHCVMKISQLAISWSPGLLWRCAPVNWPRIAWNKTKPLTR